MSGSSESRSYLVECYWPGSSEVKLERVLESLRIDGNEGEKEEQ